MSSAEVTTEEGVFETDENEDETTGLPLNGGFSSPSMGSVGWLMS